MPSKCYEICHAVDQTNNDIKKILDLIATRNIWRVKDVNVLNYLPKGFSGNYIGIKSKCTTCGYNYLTYDGIMCPCCGLLLRVSARKKVSFMEEPIQVVVRSHVGHSIISS